MHNPKRFAPLGTVFPVGWMSASSSGLVFTANRFVDKSTRFLNLDLGGFEPTSSSAAKRVEQPEKVVEEVDEAVVVEKAASRPKVNEHFVPLGPGESLWDPKIDPIRFNNILGGWVVADKGGKRAKSMRNK